jgi:hypothetical protein
LTSGLPVNDRFGILRRNHTKGGRQISGLMESGGAEKQEEKVMAARKLFFGPRPSHPELDKVREETRDLEVTDEQLAEQRISFIYGNAPVGSAITKASARAASTRFRIKTN